MLFQQKYEVIYKILSNKIYINSSYFNSIFRLKEII